MYGGSRISSSGPLNYVEINNKIHLLRDLLLPAENVQVAFFEVGTIVRYISLQSVMDALSCNDLITRAIISTESFLTIDERSQLMEYWSATCSYRTYIDIFVSLRNILHNHDNSLLYGFLTESYPVRVEFWLLANGISPVTLQRFGITLRPTSFSLDPEEEEEATRLALQALGL